MRKYGPTAASILMFTTTLLSLGVMFLPEPVRAVTITVNTTSDVISNDGFCSLREAIRASNTDTASGAATGECPAGSGDDTISIPAGTYTLSLTGVSEEAAATGDLDITATTTIVGAASSTTIIDANDIDRVFHIVSGGTRTVTFQNITVRNGCAGGVTSTNCGSQGGGGIEMNAQGTVFIDNVIIDSSRGNAGGGLHPFASNLTLNVYITNSLIQDNLATAIGGGMSSHNTTYVASTTFQNNTTVGGANGGAIGIADGVTTVTSSALINNSATGRGGAVSVQGFNSQEFGVFIARNVTMSGNSATGNGGAINVNGSPAGGSLVGCFSASQESCSVTLSNVTITNNTSAGNGGGVFVSSSATSSGQFSMSNTILANNIDSSGNTAPECSGTVTSTGNNIVSSTTGCTFNSLGSDLITSQSSLEALADNGGPTRTHALQPISAAVNAGSGCESVDQRGVARPQAGTCDIGAFELSFASSTVTVTTSSVAISEAGTTATYTIQLGQQPTSTVTLTLSPDSESTLSTSSILFTTSTWNSAVTVTVTAVNDSEVEGTHSSAISHSAAHGGIYSGISIASPIFTITDNDTAAATITTSSLALTEAGTTATYTIQLAAQPTSTVTVAVTADEESSVSTSSIAFTASNWNTAVTVTVTAANDSQVEGSHTATITHSATHDGAFNGIALSSITFTITDNDTAGVTITTSSVGITEAGATATYTIELAAQPTSTVTIAVSPDSQSTVSTSSIAFTASNWNSAVTVTVTAANDSLAEGSHTSTVSHSASHAGAFNGVSVASAAFSITDNDTAGVTVAESGGSTAVTEGGGTDTYTIVLTSQPSSTVTIALAVAGSEVTASESSVAFTSSTWDTAQTITVTAVNDSDVEGSHTDTISHTASSADSNYNAISVASVGVSVTDNDSAGGGGGGGSTTPLPPSSPRQDVIITTPGSTVTQPIISASNRLVTLQLNAGAGIQRIAFALSENFEGASQEPFAAQKVVDICGLAPVCPDGLYTVYIKFYDAYGNVAAAMPQLIRLASAGGSGNSGVSYALIKASDDPKVYVIENGVKRWIENEAAFVANGYRWETIQTVNRDVLSTLPNGAPITVAGALPQLPVTIPRVRFTQTLSTGVRSSQVENLQRVLRELGYFPRTVSPNGSFGPVTRKAVEDFQRANAIPPVGVVGPQTRAALNRSLGF